jgi:hypothetical protein
MAKVAVQCSADKFVVNQTLVLRNYISAESRKLFIAAERKIKKGCLNLKPPF